GRGNVELTSNNPIGREYVNALRFNTAAPSVCFSPDENSREDPLVFARANDWSGVADVADKLGRKGSAFYRAEGIRLTAISLLMLGQIPEAVEFAASVCVTEPHMRLIIPLQEI